MQAIVSLITQNAFYVIYLPLIMTQQMTMTQPVELSQPVEVTQPVVECVSSDDAQYRIYLPLIVNQVAAENLQQPNQYRVYLPLIMNQTGARAPECPHRVYLPIIMNQPAEPTIKPTPTATPTSTPSEYRVYLPLIVLAVQASVPNSAPTSVPTSVSSPVPTSVPEAIVPTTAEGYSEQGVHTQLRSRLNNHKRGATVITACGHMSEVRIEFANLYPNASVEVEYQQQGMKYAERHKVNGTVLTVDAKEYATVKLIYPRDGQQITVVSQQTTTNTSEISEAALMRAGFCGGSSECQDFKANNICRGKFSWDIWFM